MSRSASLNLVDDGDSFFDAASPATVDQPPPYKSLTLPAAVNDIGLPGIMSGSPGATSAIGAQVFSVLVILMTWVRSCAK